MKNFITGIILVFFLFNISAFAQAFREVKSEEKRDYINEGLSYINKGLDQLDLYMTDLTRPIKRHLRKNNLEVNFFAGVLEGYDNNVNLDPGRDKDFFTQPSLNTEVIYNYTDDVRLEMENDSTFLWYYTENAANLLDIYSQATLEMDMFDDMFTFGLNYSLEYLLFPNDEDGTYLGNKVTISSRHNLLHFLYHKLGYSFLRRDYSHDKALDGREVRTGDLREDFRHGGEYEIGLSLLDRAFLKTNIQFYRNNSNYQYYDYYDYWSFKIRPSCILMITDKLYTSGGFTFQKRKYDDRLSSDDDAHVSDETWSFNISVLYDLTKSFTFALGLSYRENASNEPLQKYSGAIWTAGLYYSF